MPDDTIDIRELLQRGYRYALSLSHDAARAEDLVQDGWLRLLAARSPLTPGTLVRAIYCRFVELYRRDRRVKFEPLVEGPTDGNGNGNGKGDGEDFRFDGEDADLDAALGRLLPEERAALYLAHVAEWSTDDIGELFEWPRGTVHSVLHRLRRRLREELSVRGTAT